jgi:methylenetetrahydrofolate dehydrogenase (NADP+)/methenyltetrahydrofolate cyclohydrolase
MSAKILDGKALAQKTKERVACEAKELSSKPGLAVILVGDNPASRVYVTSKRKDCQECGFYSEEYTLPADAQPEQLLELIDVLNGRAEIDGILVQLPLPPQFDERAVLMAIDPAKDVDCFHPTNVGRLMTGDACFQPCTPAGVMALLEEGGIDPAGKHCVVLGRSNIVGKPQAILLLQKDATVTICHSKTPDLAQECRRADILVSAVGRTGLVTPDMVRDGAVVVDVAMNRDENGKLCGDCCREVYEKSSAYTPVPGGVGPMTRAMLMENTLRAAKLHGK